MAAQILRGKQVCFHVQCSLVLYRLGAVLHVWLGSYRVHPALLPYQGKLLVYKGINLCSPPVAVHRDRGPTLWHSLTLTGLHNMSLWLLSCPSQLRQLRILSFARLCLLLLYHLLPLITSQSVWYM
jgi:hypothetical protein